MNDLEKNLTLHEKSVMQVVCFKIENYICKKGQFENGVKHRCNKSCPLKSGDLCALEVIRKIAF